VSKKESKINKKFAALVRLLSLSPVLALTHCRSAVLLHPAGPVGADEKSLIVTAVLLMLIVVVPAIVLTLSFAWKYRATNRKAQYAPKWEHSKAVEAVIWLVPLAIVLVLGTVTWISTHKLDPFRPLEPGAKPLTIEVVSLDWKWLFIYPDQGIASVNEVAFPSGVPVTFEVTSDSVMNSFFIPQLGSQIYSMAGMRTEVHLKADHPGTYDGISANFSGAGFSGMGFKALAVPAKQFEDWVGAARKSPLELGQSEYERLAKPSENNPVEYFSAVTPGLFRDIIDKYTMNRDGKAGM
jgi:cytochrome o ubiquinol oxidase subunit 2